jgi:hypothetical protein
VRQSIGGARVLSGGPLRPAFVLPDALNFFVMKNVFTVNGTESHLFVNQLYVLHVLVLICLQSFKTSSWMVLS